MISLLAKILDWPQPQRVCIGIYIIVVLASAAGSSLNGELHCQLQTGHCFYAFKTADNLLKANKKCMKEEAEKICGGKNPSTNE